VRWAALTGLVAALCLAACGSSPHRARPQPARTPRPGPGFVDRCVSLWNSEAKHAIAYRHVKAYVGSSRSMPGKCRVVLVPLASSQAGIGAVQWEEAGPHSGSGRFHVTGRGRAVRGFERDFSLEVTPEGTLGSGG
jgi:hypothetical protein